MLIALGILFGIIILLGVINCLFKRGNHYWTREEDEFWITKEEETKL